MSTFESYNSQVGGLVGAYLSSFFNGESFKIKFTLFKIDFENMKIPRCFLEVFPDFSKKACAKKVRN